MRFLTILGIFTVLVVAFVALPAATGVANPAKSGDKRVRGTTTMSPKDLFLMHAQHSTKNLPGRKKSKATTVTPKTTKTTKTTVPPTTPTTPVTPAPTAAPAADSAATTSTPAVATTTTAKPKGKGKSKGKGKGKGSDKAKTKPRAVAQSNVGSTDKSQDCKKIAGRQSRADCLKNKAVGQGKNSKTAVSPMSTTAKMTTDSTQTTKSATTLAAAAAGAPADTATVAAANPGAPTATSGTPAVTSVPTASDETVATATAASVTDKTSAKPEAVVNTDKLVSFNSAFSDMKMEGNAPQPMILGSPVKAKAITGTEVKTKAELMARDIINGTHEEHNIFP